MRPDSSRFLTLASRLNLLRKTMQEHNLCAYIIPTADAHGSECIADCDKRIEFISGSSSHATVVVSKDEALLFTDSRYFIQAKLELESSIWKLMQQGQPGVPTVAEWIIRKFSGPAQECLPVAVSFTDQQQAERENEQLSVEKVDVPMEDKRVGIDTNIISHGLFKMWHKKLREAKIVLVGIETNLVDEIWMDRPARTNNPLIILSPTLTGVFWSAKMLRVIEIMKERNTELLVVSALDEIAYLLNLRGSDIPYNPVFFSFLILTLDGVYIFMDDQKLRGTPGIVDHLTSPRMKTFLYGYEEVYKELRKLAMSCSGRIWLSPASSQRLYSCVGEDEDRICAEASPIAEMKMCKTQEEVSGIRRAHINDSIALCRFLFLLSEAMEYGRVDGILSLAPVRAYLERLQQQDNVATGGQVDGLPSENNQIMFTMTECLAAEILNDLRSKESDFIGLSFETISASGANAAIVHYRPKPSHDRPLSKKELYLVDSGGQYLSGTTDVTRTVHFGNPTEEERLHFTLVLKGYLSLQCTTFPSGTFGSSLDAIARMDMWSHGLNYGHGTGHGVGAFLNVHEGPCRISPRTSLDEKGLLLNSVITIEPGYYREDRYGIRIENVNLVIRSDVQSSTNENFGYFKKSEEQFSPLPVADKTGAVAAISSSNIEDSNDQQAGVSTNVVLMPTTASVASTTTAATTMATTTTTTTTPAAATNNNTVGSAGGGTPFLTFEPLTLVPIQRKMILLSVMQVQDVARLNAYHERCRRILMPVLVQRNLHDVAHWLNYETQPL